MPGKKFRAAALTACVLAMALMLSACSPLSWLGELLDHAKDMVTGTLEELTNREGAAQQTPEESSRPVVQVDDLEPGVAEAKVERMLEALVSGEGDEEVLVLAADGSVTELSGSDEISAALLAQVEYEVLSTAQDNDVVTAQLAITAPDISAMVDTVLEGMDTYASDIFVDRLLSLARSEDLPTRDFEVSVELRYLQGQWAIVPGAEFINAMTGGLYEAYAANQAALEQAIAQEGE